MQRDEGKTKYSEIAVSQTKPPREIEKRAKILISGVKDECERAVQRITEEVGPIEVLVNNAGITRDATLQRMSRDFARTLVSDILEGF